MTTFATVFRCARFLSFALALIALPFASGILRADTDPPADIRLTGELGGIEDLFGWSVAPAGDVNGDSFLDLIVGAPQCDEVAGYAGRAYLFYGPFTGDLTAANAGAIISAQTFGDNLGISVASASDTDKDGKDEILVGARSNDAGGTQVAAHDARALRRRLSQWRLGAGNNPPTRWRARAAEPASPGCR